ncbi:MAG: hypothetical protein JSS02_05790, partial [Planctomycetes bacterium]|nr:hypothetical protein [Planctomycetota bacterium]
MPITEHGMTAAELPRRAPPLSGGPSPEFWAEVERLLHEIAQIAKTVPLAADYSSRVLKCLLHHLPVQGARFWQQDLTGQLEVAASHVRESQTDAARPIEVDSRRQLVAETIVAGKAQILTLSTAQSTSPPVSGIKTGQETCWLCPIESEIGYRALLEVWRESEPVDDASLMLEVLNSIAELCGDLWRRDQLRQLSQARETDTRLNELMIRLLATLDLSEASYLIANEGRRFVDCDRLTVLSQQGRKCSVLAVSGVARADLRSNFAACHEELAAAVTATGQPYHYSGDTSHSPPQIRAALEAVVEMNHARGILVWPLGGRGDLAPTPESRDSNSPSRRATPAVDRFIPVGALIVEQFAGSLSPEQCRRAAALGTVS